MGPTLLAQKIKAPMGLAHKIKWRWNQHRRPNLYQSIRQFQAKIPLFYETDDFVVRAAQNSADLIRVFELRHDIFFREWQGKELENGLDVESAVDFSGDHLMIIDKSRDEVVGTYRLLCSLFTKQFYSDAEFDLSHFMRWPSVKLELGRACIKKDYRNGNTIDLLWKGLARYIALSEARFLFGCTSLKETSPAVISSLYRDFKEKDFWSDDYKIRATSQYEFPNFDIQSAQPIDKGIKRELIPPLLRSYMHAGAKIYGYPAYDAAFDCVDMLTILDMQSLNKKFRLRYFPED